MPREDLREFLQSKSGAELIFSIGKGRGSIQKEIAENVDISEPSLSNKLDLAAEIGLIEETRLAGDHGNAKRYQLTSKGEKLYVDFDERGLISKYERKQELESDIREGIRNINQDLDEILSVDTSISTNVISDPDPITEDSVSDSQDAPDPPSSIDPEKVKKLDKEPPTEGGTTDSED